MQIATRGFRGAATATAILLATIAAAMPGATVQAAPLPEASFSFDNGFEQRGGLGFAFDRDATALSVDGSPALPDVPRFAHPQHLAAPPTFEIVRPTNVFTKLLASGVDDDGTTPVVVMLDAPSGTPGVVDVYTGDPANYASATPGNGIVRTQLGDQQDIMQGTVPNRAYTPRAGVVCHGLIVLQCELFRFRKPPGLPGIWESLAVSYVVSTDGGATWTVTHEDFPSNIGNRHGRDWSFQNWFPLGAGGGPPLEAWFVGSDYRAKPNTVGGIIHLFRATRPTIGGLWTVEPVELVYQIPFDGERGKHAHAGGVVRRGENGLQVIAAMGDGRRLNTVVSVTRDDENYLDTPGWTLDEAYHGSTDPNGVYGNQFVGCAPAPDGHELLLGTDLSVEQIMRIRDIGDGSAPLTSWVFGRTTADQKTGLNFVFRSPTPELGGPYTVNWDLNTSAPANQEPTRSLYSPDGDRWAIAAAPGRPVSYATIAGDYLILPSRNGEVGVLATPLPEMFTRRPLIVEPGGVQHVTDDVTIVPGTNGGNVEPLTKNASGEWIYNGVPIDPQPPVGGPVFAITSTSTPEATFVADLLVGGTTGDIGAAAGNNRVRWRAWVLSDTESHSVVATSRLSAPGAVFEASAETIINTVFDWWPVEAVADIPLAPGQPLRYRIESGTFAPETPSYFLALDTLTEGLGWPGYSAGPDLSGTGTALPDERAAVTGVDVDNTWTVSLVGMVPDHAWDSSVEAAGTRWPLATIWADDDNHVEIAADTSDGTLRVDVTSGGAPATSLRSEPIYWLRNSGVLVSVAQNELGITASASVSGQEVNAMVERFGSQPNVPLATNPTEIRFGDASGASSDGSVVRVSPMWWFGGEVHDMALSAPDRKASLTLLDFFDPAPACVADLTTTGTANGVPDGAVDLSDFSFYLTLWSASDPRADVTSTGTANGIPDGSVDLSDFSYYLTLWSAGCP